jgi:hypothetical protein
MGKKSNKELRQERFQHRLLVAQAKGVLLPDPLAVRVYATDGTHLRTGDAVARPAMKG